MSDDFIASVRASVRAQQTLRDFLVDVANDHGCSLDSLTVLSPQNDPYRLGDDWREDAEWFAKYFYDLVPDGVRVHLRGFHYRLVSTTDIVKPNGEVYASTGEDWLWLQTRAAKAARWLGYVPFENIRDARNDEPIIRLAEAIPGRVRFGIVGVLEDLPALGAILPNLDNLVPDVQEVLREPIIPGFLISDFQRRQPYRIVLWGEKSSLDDVLGRLAHRYNAELILPTGETTDTLIFEMAQRAADDDRPTVVLYFSDFDPSGWQMPISVSRKLQGLRHLRFPDLNVQVYRIALTIQQVKEFGLPHSPLKASEKRADHWKERWGHEQTEIDALAVLQPHVLTQIAEDAILKFYDQTLEDRLRRAKQAWYREAEKRLRAHPGYDALKEAIESAYRKTASVLTDIRTTVKDVIKTALDEAKSKVDQAYDEATAAYNQLAQNQRDAQTAFENVEPPEIVVPEPKSDEASQPDPLFDSTDDFVQATHKLIRTKDLRGTVVAGTRLQRAVLGDDR